MKVGPAWWAAAAAWLLWCALVLPGCSTPGTTASGNTSNISGAPIQSLSGRLAIKAERPDGGINPSMNAAFELSGTETEGRLSLNSPLGTTLAQAQWSPTGVVLITSEGLRHFDDLDDMAQAVFGQRVPLRSLWHWLRGQPWPQATFQALPGTDGFSQQGWQVNTSNLASVGALLAQRSGPPGDVVLRIRLDR